MAKTAHAPAPAQPTLSPDGPPVALALDVNDLARSVRFYAALGFEPLRTERAGLIYELRVLRSREVPGLELRLRAAFGKRSIGSSPGSMLAVTLRVVNVRAMVDRLGAEVRWVGPAPAPAEALQTARLADPDGYVIELEQ
jgi:catechol 2,3-dioxygenase-like lactoylglutathione lyase family enzyme